MPPRELLQRVVPNASVVRLLMSVFLLILLLCSSAPICTTAADDRQALLAFKTELARGGDAPALASWVSSSRNDNNGSSSSSPSPPDFCAWRGVSCSRRRPFRVVGLDLRSQGLTGGIPPAVANLTFLEILDLSDNRLGGRIPPELGRLARLRELNLSVNSLDGEIPDALWSSCSRLQSIALWNNSLSGEIPSGSIRRCSRLSLIHFSSNKLQGSIPPELGELPALQQLILSGNKLVGGIPATLGSIPNSSLTYVNLGLNYLTGGIPTSLAASPNLQSLELPFNSLSGEIPASLFNSSSLVVIDLGRNNFTGSIPHVDVVGGSSRPLQLLTLSENSLSGSIPASLGNFSSLYGIYLNQNNLVGSIPDSLGMLPLESFEVSVNNLSGQVPLSLYNSSVLSYLNLGYNSLTGMIPSDIGFTLPSIGWLILSSNRLEGVIPASLANASGLQELDLSINSFSGFIPSLGSLPTLLTFDVGQNRFEGQQKDWGFISSLSNCSQLSKLLIDGNKFDGSLPKSIWNLSTSLTWLWVGKNRFSGNLPAEIGKFKNLTVFYADNNQLTGSIPHTIGDLQNMGSLSFSNNRLSGHIPDSLGNLQKLVELYLGMNQLEGSIPPSLQGCKSLLMLNLSSNNLDGSIPAELFTISSLSQGLDLSRNRLSGSIPSQIGTLINLGLLDLSSNHLTDQVPSSLGQCVQLQILKLDGNFLEGSIPESFNNLKGIHTLDLSQNNFSGKIPSLFESFHLLQYLNLSFNDFSGPIPAGSPFDNSSVVFLQGNKGLCTLIENSGFVRCSSATTNTRKQKTSHVLKTVLPIAVVSIILLLCLIATIFIKKARKAQTSFEIRNKKLEKVSYTDIIKATDQFSSNNLVGSGRFGKVYKGTFHFSIDPLAIKVFNLEQHGASKSFLHECEALRNIRHRNLVKVITICSSFDHTGKEFKALLFQYMSNGSLEKWIQSTIFDRERALSLGQRINIAADVAFALDYLHNQCVPPLVHCDLKPSNIVLDGDMNAYVADFGLAKFLGTENNLSESGSNSTAFHGPNGSVGYIAPEYGIINKNTTEGDVYSYGIILLQMLTGKTPIDEEFKEGFTLHNFVTEAFPVRIEEILDPILLQEIEGAHYTWEVSCQANPWMQSCIIPLVKVALLCSVEMPKHRMKMEDVCYHVSEIKDEYLRLLHSGDVQRQSHQQLFENNV
uniref:Receptor kinase-like protein Xa21 n=1 Tax=Leersia perrieri TaxID=77586 RepID=A0A0D9XRH5_9ORYZ